jgi:hypothetical protein
MRLDDEVQWLGLWRRQACDWASMFAGACINRTPLLRVLSQPRRRRPCSTAASLSPRPHHALSNPVARFCPRHSLLRPAPAASRCHACSNDSTCDRDN